MIRRFALLLLVLGSSTATKGLRRRGQDVTTPATATTTTTTSTTTETAPPFIVNTDGLPKAPKEEGLLKEEGLPKEEGFLKEEGLPKEGGLLPKAPKDDAKVKEDVLADKEEKTKKEKKEKKCKKRKKEDDPNAVLESRRRRSLQLITNEDGLAKKSTTGEAESTIAKEPPVPKTDGADQPPEPVGPPMTQPEDDNSVEPDVVEPTTGDVAPPAAATEDANEPYCADVGTKSRTQAECANLLSSGPNGQSIKGVVEFEVTYDEDDQSIMTNLQDKIKTRAALKAAGCAVDERRVLRFLQDAGTVEDDANPSTLYISGVSFGQFAVEDKCASGLVEGCDNVSAPVVIYYESEDNRAATQEEGQILMENVIKAIQAGQYEGAQIDNFVGEVHSDGKNVMGIIAGGAVAGAALVAGAVVYKRYGSKLSAKWA